MQRFDQITNAVKRKGERHENYCVSIGDEEYGISVEEVQSIEKIQHITRVPGVKEYVKGVINLRGVITPIIDLRTRFNLQEQLNHELTRIIMVRLNDVEAGLIVDAANDVVDIDEKRLLQCLKQLKEQL